MAVDKSNPRNQGSFPGIAGVVDSLVVTRKRRRAVGRESLMEVRRVLFVDEPVTTEERGQTAAEYAGDLASKVVDSLLIERKRRRLTLDSCKGVKRVLAFTSGTVKPEPDNTCSGENSGRFTTRARRISSSVCRDLFGVGRIGPIVPTTPVGVTTTTENLSTTSSEERDSASDSSIARDTPRYVLDDITNIPISVASVGASEWSSEGFEPVKDQLRSSTKHDGALGYKRPRITRFMRA